MRDASAARSEEPSPTVVRLFPLTGSLLLPGVYLPLNVFEPRYRAMVRDALADDRRIGMIQPRRPARDHRGPVPGEPESPELYAVGCLGEMIECEPQPDGRFLIVLEGVCRFRVLRELPGKDGYRRVEVDLAEFGRDLRSGDDGADGAPDVGMLLGAVSQFAERFELELDLDLLASLPVDRLVNSLSAALPFGPSERQALLEAQTVEARRDLLVELLTMALDAPERIDPYEPPPVH